MNYLGLIIEPFGAEVDESGPLHAFFPTINVADRVPAIEPLCSGSGGTKVSMARVCCCADEVAKGFGLLHTPFPSAQQRTLDIINMVRPESENGASIAKTPSIRFIVGNNTNIKFDQKSMKRSGNSKGGICSGWSLG
jgi:hypothetical protein